MISIIGNIYWQTKTSCVSYCHSDRSTIEACVDIKEEIIKLQHIKKIYFFLKWAEPGPNIWVGPYLAHLRGLGLAQPVWTVPSLFTCYVNSGGRQQRRRSKRKKKWRRADLRWREGGDDGGSRWQRRLGSSVVAAAMLLLFLCKDSNPCIFFFSFFCFYSRFSPLYPCASPLFSLYSFVFFFMFFFLFQFCSSFGLPDLLCSSLSPLLCSLSSLVVSLLVCFFFVFFFPFCTLSFFWSSPSLIFISKNKGRRRGWGGHCAAAPNRPRGTFNQ